CLQGYRVPLTF
nr:immunoglobulin light chain junction region [Macaca mulatta]